MKRWAAQAVVVLLALGALSSSVAPSAVEVTAPAPAAMASAPPSPALTSTEAAPSTVALGPSSAISVADPASAPLESAVTNIQPLTTSHLVRDDNSAQVKAVFDAINAYRASLGLGKVYYHRTVASMAQEWSDSIASREVIEHRANFWTDPRALSPNRGAGEVIAVRWDRDPAQLVAWWKSSPAHNAILTNPRLNVMGIGITFTDGKWATTPNRYAMWGVIDFFGYTTLPRGSVAAPSSTVPPAPTRSNPTQPGPKPNPGSIAFAPATCDPLVRSMPSTQDLRRASIHGRADVVAVDTSGTVWDYPATGTGGLRQRVAIANVPAGTVRVLTTDWDRDGVYDLLVQGSDGRLTLLPGKLDGGFGTGVVLGRSGWASYGLSVGEWCARNRLPQLLARDAAGALYFYPNRGLGDLAQRTSVTSVAATAKLALADVDGDGFIDLLALEGGALSVRRGSGDVSPRADAPRTLASGWSRVQSYRVVSGFTPGAEAGLVAVRTDGSAFYVGISGGRLTAATPLPGSYSGLTLAG